MVIEKVLAWDLETFKIVPEGESLDDHHPLGISVAATLTSEGDLKLWYGLLDAMTPQQCRDLVQYLWGMHFVHGYTIVGWNSAGFDFLVLAEESGMWETCKKLALYHVDGMFHFFCQEGVAVGLQAAARGLGLEGKSGSGKNAPTLWSDGKREEVLAYVSQDTKVTLDVILEIQKKGRMDWIAKSGRLMTYYLPKRKLLSVREAIKLPLPDTRWMKKPWKREKFVGWLEKEK
jgi:hypothetical protein